MAVYVFDMDGTLTPARQPMTEEFAKSFLPWLKQNQAYIATGSDFAKVREQLPASIINSFTGIFTAMGNALWQNGEYIYFRDFTPCDELLKDLEIIRSTTKYPYDLYPNYIEKRTGALNFSILGRDCPQEARKTYSAWDSKNKERLQIQAKLSKKYPQYDFSIGGSISIDIVKKGCGKGQIAKELRLIAPDEEIIFFGDKTFKGGNDYELAHELEQYNKTKVVQVENPEYVLKYLKLI